MSGNTLKEKFESLQREIETAKNNAQPIDEFVKKQIEILELARNEFREKALIQNPDFENDINYAEIELKQLMAMKQLCEQIKVPTEKYDGIIKKLRVKILGEDVVKEYFD